LKIFIVLIILGALSAQSPDEAAQSQHARQLMNQGKFAEAVKIYAELVEVSPGNTGLLLSLGIARHMAGQDKEAVAALESVLKSQPVSFLALTTAGSSYLRLNQPAKAVPLLQRALQVEPQNTNVRQTLAGAYLMISEELRLKHRYVDAIAAVKKGLALEPNDLRLRLEMAAAVYGSKDYAAAEALLRKLPSSPDVEFMLGNSLLSQKKADAAIPYLVKAVTADPQFLPAHAALGRAYVAAGMHIAAVPHLERAESLDDDGSLHYQLAQAYKAAGRANDAARAMKRSQLLSAKAKAQAPARSTASQPQRTSGSSLSGTVSPAKTRQR
jgi:tetratricopeptide (TPR) repeat protein